MHCQHPHSILHHSHAQCQSGGACMKTITMCSHLNLFTLLGYPDPLGTLAFQNQLVQSSCHSCAHWGTQPKAKHAV